MEEDQRVCYKVISGDVGWLEANETCTQGGGYVVEPRNRNQFDEVLQFMAEQGKLCFIPVVPGTCT